jgi:hypothetical protein
VTGTRFLKSRHHTAIVANRQESGNTEAAMNATDASQDRSPLRL